ncbi:hypothetical protein J7T55_009166 [Diaporthe amygdali]|uniref:uncharacterized protein n=1 Tax=Phomopsis amygdali TaxID=1214568 RepID=UPI0022FE5CD1|nr:uncharacterized protein J7T55_009166 [Diaporthe amygdali]KAJ0118383.1 hypothetical protein J7T55_009166 [Diaporthe amygdali]
MADPEETSDKPSREALEKKYQAEDNVGYNLERYGQFTLAIISYKRTLEGKTRDYGEDSTQVALTAHNLGETYLKAKRLDEAKECLEKALRIRSAHHLSQNSSQGTEDAIQSARKDAALSRDTLGRLYEECGDFEAAKDIRRAGLDAGQILCGSERVMAGPQFHYLGLHLLISLSQQCPTIELLDQKSYRTCGECGTVFYCCRDCQVEDWRLRHKQLCQRHSAMRRLTETKAAEASSSAVSSAPALESEPLAASSSSQNLASGKEKSKTSTEDDEVAEVAETLLTLKLAIERKDEMTDKNICPLPSQSQSDGPPVTSSRPSSLDNSIAASPQQEHGTPTAAELAPQPPQQDNQGASQSVRVQSAKAKRRKRRQMNKKLRQREDQKMKGKAEEVVHREESRRSRLSTTTTVQPPDSTEGTGPQNEDHIQPNADLSRTNEAQQNRESRGSRASTDSTPVPPDSSNDTSQNNTSHNQATNSTEESLRAAWEACQAARVRYEKEPGGQSPIEDMDAAWGVWQTARSRAWQENGDLVPPWETPLKWTCSEKCCCVVWKGDSLPPGH